MFFRQIQDTRAEREIMPAAASASAIRNLIKSSWQVWDFHGRQRPYRNLASTSVGQSNGDARRNCSPRKSVLKDAPRDENKDARRWTQGGSEAVWDQPGSIFALLLPPCFWNSILNVSLSILWTIINRYEPNYCFAVDQYPVPLSFTPKIWTQHPLLGCLPPNFCV